MRVAIFCILLVYQTKTLCLCKVFMLGSGDWIRTSDLGVNSAPLYR